MIVRRTLGNGLRVVVLPDPSVDVVAVAVSYRVGFRDEQPGSGGFAHLFEHLMSQGSAHLEAMEHKRNVDAVGGFTYGTTGAEHTSYCTTVPAPALDMALFCEADRMTAIRITGENVRNQVRVVSEEIRQNVLDVPYGGWPWFQLPAVAFDRFENAHDGYGALDDLERATVADAEAFFDRFYAPANAVVAIAGAVDGDIDVDRHIARVAPRSVVARGDVSEPLPAGERRGVHTDPRAPQPAVAIGYRTPDPGASFDDYCAMRVLMSLLVDGPDAALRRVAPGVSATLGIGGDWLGTLDPSLLHVDVRAVGDAGVVVHACHAAIDRMLGALDDAAVQRASARLATRHLRWVDNVGDRASAAALCELLHGRAELVASLPDVYAALDADALVKVGRRFLLETPPAVLELRT